MIAALETTCITGRVTIPNFVSIRQNLVEPINELCSTSGLMPPESELDEDPSNRFHRIMC